MEVGYTASNPWLVPQGRLTPSAAAVGRGTAGRPWREIRRGWGFPHPGGEQGMWRAFQGHLVPGVGASFARDGGVRFWVGLYLASCRFRGPSRRPSCRAIGRGGQRALVARTRSTGPLGTRGAVAVALLSVGRLQVSSPLGYALKL